MTRLNIIQLFCWSLFIFLGLFMGFADLMWRSFHPVFNGDNFALAGFSLLMITLVAIANPVLYKWFEK
jgi:hypothetical protein